ELYIRSRLAESISKRTLQNEMAALRAIFNVAGRSKLADPAHECLSNSALGLSGASRDGTKVAISDERYQAVFSVIKIKDEGVAAAVQLSRCL
ncbi:integrase domain-containing protein, partial [Pseudomonas aeruginosa]|nr:integrase domain-containing protein [Pseudomonas aeruginosa]